MWAVCSINTHLQKIWNLNDDWVVIGANETHYRECERLFFFFRKFNSKTTEWQICNLGKTMGLYQNINQAAENIEKCKEYHREKWEKER